MHLIWIHLWLNRSGNTNFKALEFLKIENIWILVLQCAKFVYQMAPLALVAKLATRWCQLHHLQIWPLDRATCISSKGSRKNISFDKLGILSQPA